MARRLSRVLISAAVGAGAGILLMADRGFQVPYALMAGLAVAVLIFVAFRTYDQLRQLYRR